MIRKKRNNSWSDFGKIAVTGIVGYVAYKYLFDNEQVSGQDLFTIPNLDKMSLGKAYPIPSLSLLDSDWEEKKKHVADLNAITKGELFIQLTEKTLTMTKMVLDFTYPKAVNMLYALLCNPNFQLDIRNRKPEDDRIWGENTGSSHVRLTSPILRQGKSNGSLIAIDRQIDSNTMYHLENEEGKSPTPYRGNISSYRVLRHELIHAYHNLVGIQIPIEKVITFTGSLSLNRIPLKIELKEALTVGIVRTKTGNWIGIRIYKDSESLFSHFEKKIPFNEAIFTKERNRIAQFEYYRVEYAGI